MSCSGRKLEKTVNEIFLLQKRNIGSILCNRDAHACRYTHRNNYLAWNLWLAKLILCRPSTVWNYWRAIRPLHQNINLTVQVKKAVFAFETQVFTTTSFTAVFHDLVSFSNDFLKIIFSFWTHWCSKFPHSFQICIKILHSGV